MSVYAWDDAVIQPLRVFVRKCLSASVYSSLCVHVLPRPAEREHPSDRRAQPWCIRAQTTTAPFCERGAEELNASPPSTGVPRTGLCNVFAALE